MRRLDGITDSKDLRLSKSWEIERTGKPGVLQSMGSQRIGHDLATEQQQQFQIFKKFSVLKIVIYKTL